MADRGRWMLVTMPDGYRVRADVRYDDWLAARFFESIVEGLGEHGEHVEVRGNYISRVHRVTPESADG